MKADWQKNGDWRIREAEAEIRLLRKELQQALEQRDRARETATRLEQEIRLAGPIRGGIGIGLGV